MGGGYGGVGGGVHEGLEGKGGPVRVHRGALFAQGAPFAVCRVGARVGARRSTGTHTHAVRMRGERVCTRVTCEDEKTVALGGPLIRLLGQLF